MATVRFDLNTAVLYRVMFFKFFFKRWFTVEFSPLGLFAGHMSEESLDRLKRDLSIMVEATMNATSENGKKVDNKKSVKKKICCYQ